MADDQVSPQDPTLRNSPLSKETPSDEAGEAHAAFAEGDQNRPGHADCYWNDKKYSDGATICDSGQRRGCWNGKWVDFGNC